MISIIIPNYNHAMFLEERLKSVFNQTFQDFEVILLDDCSTDASLEILNKYKTHPKVSHFEVSEQNSGSVFKQWIKGIKLAKGKYIWIAESDDVAHSKFLEKMFNFAEDKNDVGLVFCKSIVIDEKGAETGKILLPPEYKKDLAIYGEEDVSLYIINKLSILNASSVLFKSEAMIAVDYSQLPLFTNVGDMFTYSMIGLTKTNYFLDEFLNFHRLHYTNTTVLNSKNYKIIEDRIKLIQYFIPKFKSKASKNNILDFYSKQILKSLENSLFKLNRKTLRLLFKYRYLNYKAYYLITVLVLIHITGKEKIPHFVRKKYKRYF